VNQYPHSSTIIITGGFHTAGIADDLKLKKISYVVIAPVVEAQTAQDEAIYLKRMMGIHITGEQIAEGARAFRQKWKCYCQRMERFQRSSYELE